MSNDEYQHQLTWINVKQHNISYKIIKGNKVIELHWKDFSDLITKHKGRTPEFRNELDKLIDGKDSL